MIYSSIIIQPSSFSIHLAPSYQSHKTTLGYEKPLYAPDGSFYLPDFIITWRGERFFWEHLGLLVRDEYRRKWQTKREWYERHFPGRLVTTEEGANLSKDALALIQKHFS
jgi:hypothetical protein